LGDALASYDKALTLNPNDADACLNRGNALKNLKRLGDALASYDRALALKPDIEFLFGTRLHTKMKLCNWEGFAESVDQLIVDVSQGKLVTEPFVLLGLVDNPDLHLRSSRVYGDKNFKRQDVLGPITKRAPIGKIRIGYYSGDFRSHAVSYLMAELFELHDRSRFDVYGFSLSLDQKDEMRQRVSAAFDRIIDVFGMSNREVAKLSRELEIDIAIDLGGYTTDSRTGIFAERAAPIQVSYLGYIGTMGVDYLDYVIADKTVIPPESQSNFTEKVVYLPDSYQVNDSKRKISDRQFTKQELGLPEEGFVFCCFNDNYKVLPTTFDGWMRILKAVEGSVLWLLEDNPAAAANLRKQAELRGVDSKRLIFAHRVPFEDYLARYRAADLMLDTLPYNAGATASDALWANLPVLTHIGKSFVSRMAASLLNAIHLSELITTTQDEYEAKAIELAKHPNRLREIKDKLELNRLTTPLFDTRLFAKHIEAAYVAMYDRYQAGLPPDVIEVTHF
jgi:predicted O-linked N-acetylglucosamine transferase (SPINDLY family)